MVRQIQWLAYSFRVLWLAGGLLGIAETLATTAAPWIAAAWLAGAVSDGIGFWSAVHLGSATVALLVLRAAHPTRVAVWRWLAAGYAVLPLLAACYARTLCARRVLWRDTRYRVDRHGRVMAVQSRPAAERQTPDGQPRD
jgi:heme exporter protein D